MPPAVRLVDPSQDEYLAELESKSKKENRLFRTMANRPDALKHFVPFYRAVMGPGSVERRQKELAYLASSYANECPYCLAAHTATGKKAGVTEDELRAIQLEQNQSFSPQDRAVLQYARELTRTATHGGTRDTLAEYFNDEQIVELTLAVAMANFTNRFNNGLELQPED
jgi:uncharacterized peroxidase-related enzyme